MSVIFIISVSNERGISQFLKVGEGKGERLFMRVGDDSVGEIGTECRQWEGGGGG